MKHFVINLKRRPDRLENFFKKYPYPKESIEVVYGFDGKNQSLENKKEKKFYARFPNYRNPGEIGCFISHLRIWKKMVNENIPVAMIFEDDALFNENFKEFMETLILPENFKLLFPGGRFTKDFICPPQTIKMINDKIYSHNYDNWVNALHERTAHCYILTIETARLFIAILDTITITNEQLDHFTIYALKNNGIPIHSTYPLVCWCPMVSDSDIRNSPSPFIRNSPSPFIMHNQDNNQVNNQVNNKFCYLD